MYSKSFNINEENGFVVDYCCWSPRQIRPALQYLIFNSFGCSTKMVQAYLNRCIVPDNIKDDALAASHKIVNYVPEAVMRSVADIYEKSCPGVDLYGLQLITASHLGICAKEQHKCSS